MTRQHTASHRSWLAWGMLGLLLLWSGGRLLANELRPASVPHPETEVRPGLHYTALDVQASGYADTGRAYLARIDLTAPDVELFVTPPDARTDSTAWYRLRYPWQVAWTHDLDLVVNGALFRPPRHGYWPFSWARGHHTTIADGTASHINPKSYLLWLTRDRVPHLTTERPAPDSVLAQAQWGMGGLVRELRDGEVHPRTQRNGTADNYTMIAACAETKQLWLAAFQDVTRGTAAQIVADQGATDGLILDGGGSTAFYMSHDVQNGLGGLHLGGGRPVATHVGVRVRAATP